MNWVGLEPVAFEHVRLVTSERTSLNVALDLSQLVDDIVETDPFGLERQISRFVEKMFDLTQLCEQIDD